VGVYVACICQLLVIQDRNKIFINQFVVADLNVIAVAGAIYGILNIAAAFELRRNLNAVAVNGLGRGFCSVQFVSLTANCLTTS